jgi:hypothetical protein
MRRVAEGCRRAIYLVYDAEAVLERIQECAGDLAVPIEAWFHPPVSAPASRAFILAARA